VVAGLDSAYNRIALANGIDAATLLGLLNREFEAMGRMLDGVTFELRALKKLADRPGVPVVLDTSVLMEGYPPVQEFDWHGLDPALAGPVRLVVPILVVEELDELLHDRRAERQQKARSPRGRSSACTEAIRASLHRCQRPPSKSCSTRDGTSETRTTTLRSSSRRSGFMASPAPLCSWHLAIHARCTEPPQSAYRGCK